MTDGWTAKNADDKQRVKYRETDEKTDIYMDGRVNRQMDRQGGRTDRQMGGMGGWADGQMGGWTDKWTDGQTDRPTVEGTDRSGITKGESITVLLTSCLTCLESAV